MRRDRIVWHIKNVEEYSELDAAYIHGIIEWVKTKTQKNYRTILDVPCGNARLHPFLRKYGYEVEGFDLSCELVEEATKNGANCWRGDMSDPNSYPNKKYDVIINWFSSFGYFDDETNERILDLWYEHLTEKGILIIDTVTIDSQPSDTIKQYDNDKLVEIQEERQEGTVRHIYIRLFRDLRTRMELINEINMDLRLYSVEEMQEMLERHGFDVFVILNSYCFRPYRGKPPKAVFVAIKRDTYKTYELF